MKSYDWKISYMPPHDTIRDGLALWRACEAAGLDLIGPADSQNLMTEMYVCLTAIAMSTERAKIMSYATNPITRHPTVTASAFTSLQELAPGRLMMGIATGDSAIWSMGAKPAKLQYLRKYIEAVKALCAGESITWDGQRFRPRWHSEAFDLPTYVMCSGPKTLRMAAEVADGAVVHMGFAPEDLAGVREVIDEGRCKANRDPKTFDIWWNAPIVFDGSYEEAANRNIGWFPRWLTMGSLEGKGIPDELKDKVRELNHDQHSLDNVYRGKDREEILVERAKSLGIYDWLMHRSARLLGPPDVISNRLNELADREGLLQWIFFLYSANTTPVSGAVDERLRLIELLRSEVMPKLK